MISARRTGVAKSCSMLPRSHSRATVSAARSEETIDKIRAMTPGTIPYADRIAGLNRVLIGDEFALAFGAVMACTMPSALPIAIVAVELSAASTRSCAPAGSPRRRWRW